MPTREYAPLCLTGTPAGEGSKRLGVDQIAITIMEIYSGTCNPTTPSPEAPMRPAGILALSALLFACGGETPEAGADDAQATVADAMAPVADMIQNFQPMKLEERDVERFISVLQEFERMGVKLNENVGENPSDISSVFQGLGANAEAMAVLRDHDLDVMKFQQLGMSVMMAAAASELGDQSPDMAAEQARLEEMKATLPPEQYEAMMSARKNAEAMMVSIQNQPAGNVELVARYRDQLEAIGNKQ